MEETKTQVFDGDALSAFFAGEEQQEAPKEVEAKIEDFFKQEEDTPPEVVIPKEDAPKKQKEVENKYASKIKDYIEEGFFSDADIEVENESGEIVKVSLSELKDVTPEMFSVIKEEQKRLKAEELGEKYVSVEGLDERTKKMIELKKAGGDLSELIQEDIQYTNVLAGIDLSNEYVQEDLVRQKLKSDGLKPKYIEAEIAEMKENLTLDVEAKQIVDNYNAYYDKLVEDKKTEQLQRISEEREQQKVFKKSLNDIYRDLKLPDNISKVLLDNSTKTDEYGLTNTDKLYFDAKSDPETYAEISFFLNNKEKFKEFLGIKVKNETKLDTVRKLISLTPKALKTSADVSNKKTNEVDEFFK
jgi:hypothetical protein